jgi:hypothetical protein
MVFRGGGAVERFLDETTRNLDLIILKLLLLSLSGNLFLNVKPFIAFNIYICFPFIGGNLMANGWQSET